MRDDTGKRALTLVIVAAMVTSTFTTAAVAAGVTPTGSAADLGGGPIAADVPGPVPGSSDQFAVRQGGSCNVVQPLGDGSETVEEFYNYTVNASEVGVLYGSVGTRDLQENQTSQFFLYEGSDGVSLVLLHDSFNGSYGGTVEMSFTGLPVNSSWAVEDDDYRNRDDRFAKNGSEANASWVWQSNRNDGGAISGFNGSFDRVTIDPAFNQESSRFPYADWEGSNGSNVLNEWFYRTGDGGTEALDMNRSVTIEPGTCDDTAPEAALSVSTDNTSTAESVTFDASGSSDDAGIVEYQWDFDGDDEVDETTADPTVTHTYNQSGEFEPAVAVYDAGRNADVATAGPIAVEAAAREVNGCEVIDSPGTYELTGDVSNTSSGTCLEITSSDVTVDGAGHTIADAGGGGRSVGVGVTSGTSNVTVRNVTVDGWTVGVETRGAENVRLSGVTTRGGTYGTFTVNSNDVTIADSVSGGASSIAFSHNQARNVTLVNDTAYGSQWGFHFEQASTNATLVNLTAYDNERKDYYHYPAGYSGELNHRAVNVTADDVDFGFTGGFGATFTGADWPTPPEAAENNIGGYVQYSPVTDNPVLDSFTMPYDDAVVEDESSVTMWVYTWNEEENSRSEGTWQQLEDATVDTDENTVTTTDIQSAGYEESHVFALFGNASDVDQAPTAAIDAPANATVNETVTLSAAGSTDDGSIESYEWELGNGEIATGETAEVAYNLSGTYTVTLTVTDDAGNTDTATTEIVVAANGTDAPNGTDEPPTAAIDAPANATVNETLSLSGANSTDDGSIESYEWELGNGETATGETVDVSYDDAGNYTVALTVTDDAGNTDTTTRVLNVTANETDEAPVAVIDAPTNASVNESATFSAANSTDDGSIESYEWAFGDDENATGETVDHAYVEPGNYTVTLTVTDDAGNANTTNQTIEVTVPTTPPAAAFAVDSSATAGANVTFDATESSDENGIREYRWDFDGDGEIDVVTADPTIDHAFAATGDVEVTLTVVDGTGATATATRTVTVTDAEAPTAAINAPSNVTAGSDAVFSAVGSTDNAAITGYEWTFGDGESATGAVVQHAYGTTGSYEVTLTVTDAAGNADSVTTTVDVTAADANATTPTAELDVPGSASVGESVALDASGSSADGGIAEYRWDFDGDGTVDETTTNATVDHAFDTAGTTTVVVTVVDANGSAASALGTIEVTEDEAPVVVIDGPSTVDTDETLSLSGANSTDDGSIESYEWELGNGETATGETVDVSYDDAGNYTVALTVTDDAGNNATGTLTVTVEAAAGNGNGGNGGGNGGGGGGDDDDDDGNGGSDGNDGGGGDGDDDGGNGDIGSGDDGNDGGDSESDDEGTETSTPTPEPQPADISVTALEANRTTIGTGQAIEFTATVENTGDEAGSYTVELELFGETVAEQTVDVAGGETTTVSFVRSIDAPGSYTARAGDESVEVTVQSAASGGTGTAAQTTTSTPGFGPIAVLLALVALAGLAVGTRRTNE